MGEQNQHSIDHTCARRSLACVAWLLVLLVAASPVVAAASSNATDWTELGLRYLHGEGVERDPDRAVVYLCAAARRQHGPAAFELGWIYLQGRGVPKDDALAAAWLHEAARMGETPPARLMDSLSSITPKPLQCVVGNGQDLQVTDAQHAEFMVAIHEMAPHYDLDPVLVLEVVRAESNFDPRARSHKGALGLMQLIPATARRFGVRDPFEPVQNLRGGMAYLRWLLQRFGGDLRLTLAGYNAGEAAVERHGGIPPYAETRAYVGRILERYGKHRADDSLI